MADNKNNVDANSFAGDKSAELWFEKNWKKALVFIVLLMIVGMAVFAALYLKKQKENDLMQAFAAVEDAELAALLEKNPAASGAAAARAKLAEKLLSEKKYDAAKNQFKLLAADNNAASELRSRAKLGSVACDELAGNKKVAAENYLLLVNDTSIPRRVRDEAAFQAGRILAEISDARGKEVLKKLVDSPADTSMANPWQAHAVALLKNLK